MKNLKFVSILALILFISSCASTVKFPVSSVVPAADIVAKKQHDKNGNFKLTLTAKNLADAERLYPSNSNFVVWIESESDQIRSIGRLLNKNGKTKSITALVPFNFKKVYITAEEKGEVSMPSGPEIARAEFKK